MQPVVASTPEELTEIIRRRVDELNLSYATVDAVAGLPDAYMSRLMAPTRLRRFGSTSLPLVLRALALKLVRVTVAEDPAQAERMRPRWTPRRRPPVRRKQPLHKDVAATCSQGDLFPTDKGRA